MAACDDRQLTQAQRQAGYQNARTGVQRAVRPFSGPATPENIADYLQREVYPALKATRDKVNECYLPIVDNAPSGNPLGYYFSDNIANADPTAGRVRLNTATHSAATVIRVSEQNARLISTIAWLDVMAGSVTAPLGVVTISDAVNPARFVRFDLLTMVDQGAYWDLTVNPVEASGLAPFVEGEGVVIAFIPGVAAQGTTLAPGVVAAIAGDGMSLDAVNNELDVGAGDGIDVFFDSVAVDVTDIVDNVSITEVATNNIQRAALTGFADAAAGLNATTSAEPIVAYSASANMTNERVTTSSTSVAVSIAVASQIEFQRAALTGFAVAAANVNATTSAEPIVTFGASANMSNERVLSPGTGTTVNTSVGSQIAIDVAIPLTDGDKGDIVVSGSGTVFTIDAGVIVDADVNASAAIAMTKTGALTGDVTKASGASVTAIAAGVIIDADVNASAAIALSKLANVTGPVFVGLTTGTGPPVAMTPTASTALLDSFTGSAKGLVPASAGGTTNYLRADGAYAAPLGSGPTYSVGDTTLTLTGTAFTRAAITGDATIAAGSNVSAINTFTGSAKGLVPVSAGGTVNYLRADGTFAAPPGGSTYTAGDTTLTLTGTAFTRAAITGDVTIAVGSNVSAIAASVIVDADVNASAAIAMTKTAALIGDVTKASGSDTTAIAAGVIVDADVNAAAAIAMTKTGALTGDVTKASGASVTAIAAGVIVDADVNASAAIALSKLASVTGPVFLGLTTGTGPPGAMTPTASTALLDSFAGSLKGLVPASAGGTVNYLRADGTFATPPDNNTTYSVGDATLTLTGTAFTRAAITGDATIAAGSNVSAIATFAGSAKGLVPASAGGTVNYLRADGAYAAPPDNDTTYGVGDTTLVLTGTAFTRAAITGDATIAAGSNVSAIATFAGSAKGLVPASAGVATEYLNGAGVFTTPPDNDTTYGVGDTTLTLTGTAFTRAAITGDATIAAGSNVSAIATFAGSTKGLVPASAGVATDYLNGAGAFTTPPDTNTTYTAGDATLTLTGTAFTRAAITGDATIAAGSNVSAIATFAGSAKGLVPVSLGGTVNYLRADGAYAAPPDTNTTYTAGDTTVTLTGTAFTRPAITGDVTLAAASNVSAIAAGVIVDADVNASAAIALSKLAIDGDRGHIVVSASGATWLWDTTVSITGSQTIAATSALTLTAGTDVSSTAADDWLASSTSGGVSIAAGAAANGAVAAGEMLLSATGNMGLSATASFRITTNAVERLEIESDGAWQLAGVTGTAGQILASQGASAPPTWVTSAALTDGDKGDIVVSSSGTVWSIDAGVIVDADVNAAAAIAMTKTGALTGDVTKASGASVTAIGAGVIVDADVNASAAIAMTKTAALTGEVTKASGSSATVIDRGTDFVWTGSHRFQDRFMLDSVTTTALTGQVDDFGVGGVNVVRFSGPVNLLTGMGTGIAGQTILLVNVHASASVVIADEHPSSVAANRFAINGTSRTLPPESMCLAWYDSTSSRWRLSRMDT